MKAHNFDPNEPFVIISLWATIKLASDTNRIRDRATLCLLQHYVYETCANALSSRMCAENRAAPSIATVSNNDTMWRALLR